MVAGGTVSAPDPRFEQLLEFVRDERGFDYTGYRRPTLMRRFEKRMQTVNADDWEAYRAYLSQHPEEFVELFNTILINVTGFFRDAETWDVVAAEIIPSLLHERPEEAPSESGPRAARRARSRTPWRCCWPRRSVRRDSGGA